VFEWMERRGRLGGLLGIVLGVLVLGFCLVDILFTGSCFIILLLAGFVLVAIGLINLIFGGGETARAARWERKQRKAPAPRTRRRKFTEQDLTNLRRDLAKHSFPYVLCMNNGLVVGDPSRRGEGSDPCERCRPALDHIEITDADDLNIALVSMEG